MSEEPAKTTEEWAKELGFGTMEILVDGSTTMGMVVDRSFGYEYTRPHRFELIGYEANGHKTKLGHLKTVELYVEEALADGVYIEESAAAQFWARAVRVALEHGSGTKNALLLDSFCIVPEYRGRGLAKHLFDRALAYSKFHRMGCVVACSHTGYFRENADGDFRRWGITWVHEVASWGFRAIPDTSPQGPYDFTERCNDYVMILDKEQDAETSGPSNRYDVLMRSSGIFLGLGKDVV